MLHCLCCHFIFCSKILNFMKCISYNGPNIAWRSCSYNSHIQLKQIFKELMISKFLCSSCPLISKGFWMTDCHWSEMLSHCFSTSLLPMDIDLTPNYPPFINNHRLVIKPGTAFMNKQILFLSFTPWQIFLMLVVSISFFFYPLFNSC